MDKTFVSFKESLLPVNQIVLSNDEMLLVRGGNSSSGSDGAGCGCSGGKGCGCDDGNGCGCSCESGGGCGCKHSDGGQAGSGCEGQ